MFSIIIIVSIVIFGGSIAFFGDHVGMKVGKKRLSLFGLRPKYTSMIITVLTGFFIAGLTLFILTVMSEYARTALFELNSIQQELKATTTKISYLTNEIKQKEVDLTQAMAQRNKVEAQYNTATADLESKKKELKLTRNRLNSLTRIKDDLELKNSDLIQQKTRLNQQVQNLEGWLANLEDRNQRIVDKQIIFYVGEILVAKIVDPGISKEKVLETVVEPLLNKANELALKRGARIPWKSYALRGIPQRISDVCAQIASLKTKAVLRVVIDKNSVTGEPAMVDLKVYPDELIFRNGETIEKVEITSAISETELREQLLSLLILAKTKAIDSGIITKGPDLSNLIPVYEIAHTIQQIREKDNGFYKISLVATDDIRRVDPFNKIKFNLANLN